MKTQFVAKQFSRCIGTERVGATKGELLWQNVFRVNNNQAPQYLPPVQSIPQVDTASIKEQPDVWNLVFSGTKTA